MSQRNQQPGSADDIVRTGAGRGVCFMPPSYPDDPRQLGLEPVAWVLLLLKQPPFLTDAMALTSDAVRVIYGRKLRST